MSEGELPRALEERISALERRGATADFDRESWLWMVVLGIAIPILLILLGWWA